MAGQPLSNRDANLLEMMGEETIARMVAEGSSVRELCAELGVSVSGYYKWLDQGETDRRELMARMRKVYAEGLDHEGKEIADNVRPVKDEVAKAKLQIDQRRHLAAMKDRTRQNRQDGAGTVVNIANLHLTAVKELEAETKRDAPVLEGEYEITEGDG